MTAYCKADGRCGSSVFSAFPRSVLLMSTPTQTGTKGIESTEPRNFVNLNPNDKRKIKRTVLAVIWLKIHLNMKLHWSDMMEATSLKNFSNNGLPPKYFISSMISPSSFSSLHLVYVSEPIFSKREIQWRFTSSFSVLCFTMFKTWPLSGWPLWIAWMIGKLNFPSVKS